MGNLLAVNVKAMGIGICDHPGFGMTGIALHSLDVAMAQLSFQRSTAMAEAVEHNYMFFDMGNGIRLFLSLPKIFTISFLFVIIKMSRNSQQIFIALKNEREGSDDGEATDS